jgi:hypothetical protein
LQDDALMSRMIVILAAATLAGSAASAPLVSEAVKLVGADRVNTHTLETFWNGRRTVFVDYLNGPSGEADRLLYAVQQQGEHLRAAKVTVGEQNGGDADLAAIGFVNADHDGAKELAVIMKWDVNHATVGGTFYQVQLLDDWKDGRGSLKPLTRLTAHFGSDCDCTRDDGTTTHFRFKTMAAVRHELRRLGY